MPAREAIHLAGGPSVVIDAIEHVTGERLARQSVHQWGVVPTDRVPVIAALSGLSFEDIRPDIFAPIALPGALFLRREEWLERKAASRAAVRRGRAVARRTAA